MTDIPASRTEEIFHLSFVICHLSFRAGEAKPFPTQRFLIFACGHYLESEQRKFPAEG
jgi:hypothetical protein